MTPPLGGPNLVPMRLLTKLSDPVNLQILCDALGDRHIRFRVDHAGINALLPLPGVMDVHVMVDEGDADAAKRILRDLGMDA
jgi:Putative prokaryotic signal transducing protein